jgi:hypothetical protein
MNKVVSIYEQKALLFAEKYGIIEYKVRKDKMIYYTSYPMEHMTYKCIVDLKIMKEARTHLKRYYKKYPKCL